MKDKDKNAKTSIKKELLDLGIRILTISIIAYIALGHIFLIQQSKGMDMFPAIKDSDLMIAFRLHKSYDKNDVLVYVNNDEKRVGRIIARESDIVSIEEDGRLSVNGTLQSGEIMYPTYPLDVLDYPYQVPKDHLFILGDFRTQALDSRDLGAIPKEKTLGKVITILRRQGI